MVAMLACGACGKQQKSAPSPSKRFLEARARFLTDIESADLDLSAAEGAKGRANYKELRVKAVLTATSNWLDALEDFPHIDHPGDDLAECYTATTRSLDTLRSSLIPIRTLAQGPSPQTPEDRIRQADAVDSKWSEAQPQIASAVCELRRGEACRGLGVKPAKGGISHDLLCP